VFFLSEKDKKYTEKYRELLDQNVPEQMLSIESSNVLRKAEKKYIVETLTSGSISLEKREKMSEETYLMMRKFTLILVNDIANDRNSIVRTGISRIFKSW